MMREAQKMMADPTFQERMKQYTENDAFKKHMEKTKETLQDKEKVKELEEAMKGRIEEGEKELEELKKKSAELEAEEKTKADELKVSEGDRALRGFEIYIMSRVIFFSLDVWVSILIGDFVCLYSSFEMDFRSSLARFVWGAVDSTYLRDSSRRIRK